MLYLAGFAIIFYLNAKEETVLILGNSFAFTFVTMVGGNPKHDAYGFRYWNHPGAFAEYITTGSLGRFEGFLGSLWAASFCIVGPEYISMVAAEAKRPRIYIKQAFKTIYWRFGIFFIGGALCAGIVVSPALFICVRAFWTERLPTSAPNSCTALQAEANGLL